MQLFEELKELVWRRGSYPYPFDRSRDRSGAPPEGPRHWIARFFGLDNGEEEDLDGMALRYWTRDTKYTSKGT